RTTGSRSARLIAADDTAPAPAAPTRPPRPQGSGPPTSHHHTLSPPPEPPPLRSPDPPNRPPTAGKRAQRRPKHGDNHTSGRQRTSGDNAAFQSAFSGRSRLAGANPNPHPSR